MMERSSFSLTPSSFAVQMTFWRSSGSLQLASAERNALQKKHKIRTITILALCRFTIINLGDIPMAFFSALQLNNNWYDCSDIFKNLRPLHPQIGLHDHENQLLKGK